MYLTFDYCHMLCCGRELTNLIQVSRGIQFMLWSYMLSTSSFFFLHIHKLLSFYTICMTNMMKDGMKKFLAMKINKLSCQLTSTFVLLLLVHCPSFSTF